RNHCSLRLRSGSDPVVERSRNHCILCISHVLLDSTSYASPYPLPILSLSSPYPLPINSCKIGTI
ncbi:MAG: hypothetical protein LWX70_04365, partial [Sphingobacteriia bacterium]|nr:hypothetical protein [Sphingobacteriia bacterium]